MRSSHREHVDSTARPRGAARVACADSEPTNQVQGQWVQVRRSRRLVPTARTGSDPDRRRGALPRAEAGRRVRHRYDALAVGQTLHIVAVLGAGQQDLGRQGALFQDRRSGRAAAALRLAATAVGKTNTALGAFYRRLSARTGKAKAVTATARKIAVLFYNALRHGMQYKDPGATYYEERYRQRVVENLRRRAASLGYALQKESCLGDVS